MVPSLLFLSVSFPILSALSLFKRNKGEQGRGGLPPGSITLGPPSAWRVTTFLPVGGSRLLMVSCLPRSPLRPSCVLSAGAAPPVRGAGG